MTTLDVCQVPAELIFLPGPPPPALPSTTQPAVQPVVQPAVQPVPEEIPVPVFVTPAVVPAEAAPAGISFLTVSAIIASAEMNVRL
jgi:hypothetical protein